MSEETRTSCERSQACVTEAILSTLTVLMVMVFPLLLHGGIARPPVKNAGERRDLREAERIRGRPLARGLAVHTLRRRHQRMWRIDTFDEQTAWAHEHV